MPTIAFAEKIFRLQCESVASHPDGYFLTGKNILIELPPTCHIFYRHGWHSWALTAWTNLLPLPAPKPEPMAPFHQDPVYTRHPYPHGSWLGAADLGDGDILLLGALGLDSHVQMRQGALQGWFETDQAEAESQRWFIACGPESQVFEAYARLLSQVFGQAPARSTRRVWCSWYSLFTAIDEDILARVFEGLNGLPFDTLQIDDGWQAAIGDWHANAKFPSGMTALAQKIKATGRNAGLWLAPLLLVRSSRTYHEHPDWLLRDEAGKPVPAGFNWGEQLYALDTTHPGVSEWLATLMRDVRSWGFDYIKLDFLYAGALPGKRHIDMPREAAYRQGLRVLREAMGPEAFFLACGAPILPSLGLCDALRIGPDVSGDWENYRDSVLLSNPTTPSTKNAIRTSLNRLWLAPVVQTDPDVVYFCSRENRLTADQKALLQDLALICDFRATSDLPQWLSEQERAALERFLGAPQPIIHRTSRYTFEIGGRQVDFGPAMALPVRPHGASLLISTLVGWLSGQAPVLKLFDQIGKTGLENIKRQLRVNNS